jgi:hypothetical protein
MAGIDMSIPGSDEAEISIFGPGYGECIVVHLGNGQWLVNDSCIDGNPPLRQPAALGYLSTLGVGYSSVKLIIASHWHDDHIRGLARIVEACDQASFVCSLALKCDEFRKLVTVASADPSRLGSGISEFRKIIQILRDRRPGSSLPSITWAIAERVLWRKSDGTASVHALAPSSDTVTASQLEIATLVEEVGNHRIRITPNGLNDTSVVSIVDLGHCAVLLGGDLETHREPGRGWTAVLESTTRHPARASAYKVAHHGSPTGHLDRIWSELLHDNPCTLITPWNKGKGSLPRDADIERIRGLSGATCLTSRRAAPRPVPRDNAVEVAMRGSTRTWRRINAPMGHVQLRKWPHEKDWRIASSEVAQVWDDRRSL